MALPLRRRGELQLFTLNKLAKLIALLSSPGTSLARQGSLVNGDRNGLNSNVRGHTPEESDDSTPSGASRRRVPQRGH